MSRIEKLILAAIGVLLLIMACGFYMNHLHWQRCRELGGFKRAVGTETITTFNTTTITNADGTTTTITTPSQVPVTVYECQDAEGRFIDVDAVPTRRARPQGMTQ